MQAYKDACMLMELEMKRKTPSGKARLNVLYILSAICRKSKKLHAAKDKYCKLLSLHCIFENGLSETLMTHQSHPAITSAWHLDKEICKEICGCFRACNLFAAVCVLVSGLCMIKCRNSVITNSHLLSSCPSRARVRKDTYICLLDL